MHKKTLLFEKEEIIDQKASENLFHLDTFKKTMGIQVVCCNEEKLELEITSIDASIANALRRIIIAEIPTMAFHKVLLYQNTSVLPDELLVHRLGLLPLKVDANLFENRSKELTAENSLKFELKVTCKRKADYMNTSEKELESLDPSVYLQNSSVYSGALKWIPQGNQAAKLKGVSLVHGNILVAKLRENQQINLEIYAEKGIGKKHAKWSPVSTCFYRLMPSINLAPAFNHEKNADTLVSCCYAQVFAKKKGKAIVAKSRDCTTCRQCINIEGVSLGKIKDHFIFTIESIGVYCPEDIFLRALKVLEDKAKAYVI